MASVERERPDVNLIRAGAFREQRGAQLKVWGIDRENIEPKIASQMRHRGGFFARAS